ncbi:MAG TPA: hypothetical protein VFP60_19585 [Pseudolabrys sp.]|nr:hypothetical protein [Pseudolabrys sp.]
MSLRIMAAAALTICAVLFAAPPQPATSALPNEAAIGIDFDALRAEAAAALQALQQSRERRVASVAPGTF